jgi:hypothetical protein
MGIRGELFSTRVLLQNRTYFFNVKENRMGDLYLNIVESKNRETGGFERQSVVLFADDLQEFLKGFDDSLRVMEKAVREKKRAAPRPVRDSGRGDGREADGESRGNHSESRGKGRAPAGESAGGGRRYRSKAPQEDRNDAKVRSERKPRRVVVKKQKD